MSTFSKKCRRNGPGSMLGKSVWGRLNSDSSLDIFYLMSSPAQRNVSTRFTSSIFAKVSIYSECLLHPCMQAICLISCADVRGTAKSLWTAISAESMNKAASAFSDHTLLIPTVL